MGGCVRDFIRGELPDDYDFATPHPVDMVEKAIQASGRRAYQIGNSKRHGTIACKIDGQEIQITTFRTEEYIPGSRQPIVTPTESLHQDLARRDFTMNAMALGMDGLYDPFNGKADIARKCICSVGHSAKMLIDDPLRILRALRFMGTFGYTLDPDLAHQIALNRVRLLEISKERWVQEFDKLLMGSYAHMAILSMQAFHLFEIILPELNKLRFPYQTITLSGTLNDRWYQLLSMFELPQFLEVRDEKYVSLFKADMMRKFAFHLKFSKERTKHLVDCALNADRLNT